MSQVNFFMVDADKRELGGSESEKLTRPEITVARLTEDVRPGEVDHAAKAGQARLADHGLDALARRCRGEVTAHGDLVDVLAAVKHSTRSAMPATLCCA